LEKNPNEHDLDFTIVQVALPSIGRGFGVSLNGLQWIVTTYGLTLAGFLLLSGRPARAQVQTQQAPRFAYSLPWTNNLSTLNPNINSFQVLCGYGICDQSSDPNISNHDNPIRSPWTNNMD
jgi:hypothetical protein